MATKPKLASVFAERKLTVRPDSSGGVIRHAYAPKLRVALVFPEGGGRTKQAFKAECDINNIMSRFAKTGVLDFTNRRQAQYGDVTGLDYQRAMDIVVEAKAMFAELPSSVRSRFHNEPAEFLEFVQDPANGEEMVKMGLAKARPMVATEGSGADSPGPEATKGAPKGAQVDVAGGHRGEPSPPNQPPLAASGKS